MKIRHIASTGTNITDKVNNYFQFTKTQFLQYFFDIDEPIEWVHEDEPADVCVYSIQLNDESMLRDNEVNVFFSIENMNIGHIEAIISFIIHLNGTNLKDKHIYTNDIDCIVRKDTILFFQPFIFD